MESPAEQGCSLRLSFPCELTHVRGIAGKAHQFLAQLGCNEDAVLDCELALVEACNNAVQYAPERARGMPVCVELLCDAACIEMRVMDHTLGFEWPETVSLPEPDSERGRGLFLIRSVMNHAQYIRGTEQNVLLLRRSRSA